MCSAFSVVQIQPQCAISIHLSWLSKLNWLIDIKKVPDTKSYLSTLIQKSCVFKLFHSGERIQKVPFLRIFLCGYVRCSVVGRPNNNNKVAFSNYPAVVVCEAIDSTFLFEMELHTNKGK